MRALRWCGLLTAAVLALGAAGCAAGADDDAGIPETFDDGRVDSDVPVEAEAETPEPCTSSAECDDGIACTSDSCGPDRTCRHLPVDGLCPDGQRCVPGTGCTGTPTDCTGHAECSDGLRCNGDEQCLAGRCYGGTPLDCNDGDPCTTDFCNPGTDACDHDFAPGEGCEADGGDVTEPFDPARHYAGRFNLAPGLSSDCGMASYNITSVSFSLAGDTLSVTGPPCTLTQTPAPTDEHFAVSCNQGSCGTYTLAGRFTDSATFEAHWTAGFGGGCASCSPQSTDVWGVRP